MLTNIKQKVDSKIDMKTVNSVIAAGAVLSIAIFLLRKAGLGKVATVVAKAK